MQLNYHVIKQIISDLDKSIDLHRLIKVLYPNCTCNNASESIKKCFLCKCKEAIDDLDCLKSHLEPISKNTINHLQLIEAEAFRFALNEHLSFNESVRCYPIYNDPNADHNSDPKDADSFAIECTTSRYAMDGNGYHVGYENVTYQWKAMRKSDLNLRGIPLLLSNWVIDPTNYEIIKKDLPDNELPDPDHSHDDDCEFKGKGFDDCDCAEYFEGYWQPDDDFFYQEMESIIDQLKYPEAEFDSDKREWQLGEVSFNLLFCINCPYLIDEYQNDPDYADDCNCNYGEPFIE